VTVSNTIQADGGGSWESDLRAAARTFDWPRVTQIAQSYIAYLRDSVAPPLDVAKDLLQLLRENLRYDDLRAVADAVLAHHLSEAVVRRQYAQALVDGGNPAAALLLFTEIMNDSLAPNEERIEARGGVGRCYKQLFIVTSDVARRGDFLDRALHAYLEAYREDITRFWHGINAVALLAHAHRESLDVRGVADPNSMARDMAAEILATVDALPAPDAWAKATACEALIALGRDEEAVRRGNAFVQHPDAGAFKIASFLRQLLDIWQLNTTGPPGDTLLPVLRSAVLRYSGGGVVVQTWDVRASRLAEPLNRQLEKVLGGDRYQSLTWYRNGLARCRAVAQIENANEDGIGTGFLIRGPDLHPDLPPTVLITNGHVVPEAVPASEAVVVFHGLDGDAGVQRRFSVVRQWWYQPSTSPHLDTTLLELDGHPDRVDAVPIASRLPRMADGTPRAYLIGYPRGLTQPQFSLQDNMLLDYDDTLIHYRSPTEGGSSGSPVFDNQWKLIGLHHAGGFETPRLNNHGGTYPANEAIAINAIAKRLREDPLTPQDVT
jgi:V8-like Glu-specific endopeptidase